MSPGGRRARPRNLAGARHPPSISGTIRWIHKRSRLHPSPRRAPIVFPRIPAVAGALVLGLILSVATQAAPTLVPGTQVTLDPPEGFAPADRFPGFQKPEAAASVMVTELPAPVAQLRQAMTAEGLATRGLTLISSDSVQVNGVDSLLLQVSQTANGMDFLKWMLITGDDKQTVMVVATFPKEAAAQFSDPMRQSVLSMTRDANAKVDPWDGLQYRVAPAAPLKFVKRISNSVMYNESGTLAGSGPGEAIYIVGSSVADPGLADLKGFSEKRAAGVTQVKDLEKIKGRKVKVDGMEAYELVADAKDARTEAPVKLYQTIAKEPGGYYIFLGAVGAKKGDAMVKAFRAATATFKRVAKPR